MAPHAILRFLHLALAVWANTQRDSTNEALSATIQLTDRLVFAHFMVCMGQ